MNLLVTGGAGFIGSHLCDTLLARGHRVTAIDNLSLGKISNIHHLASNLAFRFYQMDLNKGDDLIKVIKENSIDAVFHLAANSDIGKSFTHPETDLYNTFMTTFNVLNALKICEVKQLIFASTSAIYGELTGKLCEDTGPLKPVSHYGAGKLSSEAFVSSFANNYNIKTWIIRFPNVVGGRATHGVIHDFIKKLKMNQNILEVLGDGHQCKPYLYVKDLISAILLIWEKSTDHLNVFNVGVQSKTTVARIAELVIEEMKLSARISYTGGKRGWVGDVPTFEYSLEKVHQLGWKAELESDEAVRSAIRAILESKDESGHRRGGEGDQAGPSRQTETDGDSGWPHAA